MNSSNVSNSSCRIAISIVWSALIIPAAGFTYFKFQTMFMCIVLFFSNNKLKMLEIYLKPPGEAERTSWSMIGCLSVTVD